MRPSALAAFEHYRREPWSFLTDCVFTRDQVDQKNPIKPFPKDWDYLRLYCLVWQKNKRMAVPKSRRMFCSWINIGLYLWSAMFHPGQDFAFVSKKEEDAADLVKRAEFIYDHIPETKIPKELLPKKVSQVGKLIFPDINSQIRGFPMTADQLRQFTFSGILGDESAFWPEFMKFFSAAIPTTEGGGRCTLISSRSPGGFQRVVYDQLDNDDPINEEQTPPKSYPLGDDSVIMWQNPKNKFLVFDLHYSANPNKRSKEFREAVRNSMPIKEFNVEYERSWEAFEGKPVFEDYNKGRHETLQPTEPELGLPLLLGWDFGLTPAAVVAQLREGRLFILREYVSENSSIEKFYPRVMSDLLTHYPEWRDAKRDFIHYIDPAGLAEAQTDQRTCAGVMAAKGAKNIFQGPIDWESRRKAVEHFLITHTKGGANFQLFAKTAPKLSKGLSGAYVYPEKYAQVEPGKPRPLKNEYSHVADALQYLCGGALTLTKRKPAVEIPIPQYSLTGAGETKQESSREEYGINSGGAIG